MHLYEHIAYTAVVYITMSEDMGHLERNVLDGIEYGQEIVDCAYAIVEKFPRMRYAKPNNSHKYTGAVTYKDQRGMAAIKLLCKETLLVHE